MSERASERAAASAHIRGTRGDRDRENERSPPTHLAPRRANAGAACRRNWLSQRGHITGHYGTLTGRSLWPASVRPRDADVRVSLYPRETRPRRDVAEKERAGKRSCRSRSS